MLVAYTYFTHLDSRIRLRFHGTTVVHPLENWTRSRDMIQGLRLLRDNRRIRTGDNISEFCMLWWSTS